MIQCITCHNQDIELRELASRVAELELKVGEIQGAETAQFWFNEADRLKKINAKFLEVIEQKNETICNLHKQLDACKDYVPGVCL